MAELSIEKVTVGEEPKTCTYYSMNADSVINRAIMICRHELSGNMLMYTTGTGDDTQLSMLLSNDEVLLLRRMLDVYIEDNEID